jgi:large subunit ribosomal protein L3
MARRIRKTILGLKVGMSKKYNEDGVSVPVTLIQAGPCTVLQIKTEKTDGYSAIQVGFLDNKKKVKKPQEGHFKKANTAPKRFVKEIPRLADQEYVLGDTFDLSVLEGVEKVDVTGVTKGRGFQGTVRRWNHAIGPRSHGSKSKRTSGSLGMHQDPGRILKGKKMPGQYGHVQVKTRNLDVVEIDVEKNLLVVRGSVPGPKGETLYIEESL